MSRPEGAWTPNLRIHAECSNHLSYQGQTFSVWTANQHSHQTTVLNISPICVIWSMDSKQPLSKNRKHQILKLALHLMHAVILLAKLRLITSEEQQFWTTLCISTQINGILRGKTQNYTTGCDTTLCKTAFRCGLGERQIPQFQRIGYVFCVLNVLLCAPYPFYLSVTITLAHQTIALN